MSTATSTSAKRAKKNLFKDAAQKTAAEIKAGQTKGTTIDLPSGEHPPTHLHDAVTDIVNGTREKSIAENKLNLAKGVLGKYAHDEVIRRMVEKGEQLPGPVKFTNSKLESATYMMVDKSNQYPLSADEVEGLELLFGVEEAKKLIKSEEVYGFSPTVMKEKVSSGETVKDVVADLLSQAIMSTKRLTAEQKKGLITCTVVKRLKPDSHKNAVTICHRNFSKIREFFEVCKRQICRYLQQ